MLTYSELDLILVKNTLNKIQPMQKNKWNIKEKTIVKRIPISYDKKVDDFIFREEKKKLKKKRSASEVAD
ncbi:MAG: hypothetical protein RLY43_558 [Bacteroidota bacterium]